MSRAALQAIADGAAPTSIGTSLLTAASFSAAATVLGAPAPTIKTADTTRTNTATVAADPHLVFAIGANEKWALIYVLYCIAASSNPDLRFTLDGPASPASVIYAAYGPRISSADDLIKASAPATAYGTESQVGLLATMTPVIVYAEIENGTTAGNVSLKWAQWALDAVNSTTIKAGSYVQGRRIA